MIDSSATTDWQIPDWGNAAAEESRRELERLRRWERWPGFHHRSPLILRRPEGSYVVIERAASEVVDRP